MRIEPGSGGGSGPARRYCARRRKPRRSRRPPPARTRGQCAPKARARLSRRSLALEFAKRPQDRERRAHRTFGVVLLRLGVAEQRHQPVAELLQHMTAKIGHRSRSLVEIGVDEVAPVLGVQLRGEARRADEIAKHDSDRAALGRELEDPRSLQLAAEKQRCSRKRRCARPVLRLRQAACADRRPQRHRCP